MRVLVAVCLVLLGGCGQFVRAPDSAPPPNAERAWQQVLERFVDDAGRVDYAGLGRERAQLDAFVASIHAEGVRGQPLAWHIDAYNALAMYNVVERGVPASLDGFEKVRFFYLRRFALGGEALSLYAYENDIIRKEGEERVHFALNCMVAGCPQLPRETFRARTRDLDAVLDRETRRFLNEPRNVQVEDATRTVRLSSIFAFYAEDFLAKAPSLVAYVNRYRVERVPEDYRVQFIPYDWTLNARSPPAIPTKGVAAQ